VITRLLLSNEFVKGRVELDELEPEEAMAAGSMIASEKIEGHLGVMRGDL
jgi:hypothetical protein